MKKLILLVGPMGSGKSTLCNTGYSEYYRISQDEMGPVLHFTNFMTALNEGKNIIVDRCNFSYSQRAKFLDSAKAFNYNTKIIVLNRPFKTCYERILKRKEHPTLTGSDPTHILAALTMYFNQYDYVQDYEADGVDRL